MTVQTIIEDVIEIVAISTFVGALLLVIGF